MSTIQHIEQLKWFDVLTLLSSIRHEIKHIHMNARQNEQYFSLLDSRFERMVQFMHSTEYVHYWPHIEHLSCIKHCVRQLRATTVYALCDREKACALCTDLNLTGMDYYLEKLTQSLILELEKSAINAQSYIAFIGSGAKPTTALYLAQVVGAQVVCYDKDHHAQTIARTLIHDLGLSQRIQFIDSLQTLKQILPATSHIIIAALVDKKAHLLNELRPYIPSGTKVLLRYGNGIKSIFNYPFIPQALNHPWHTQSLMAERTLYDVTILEAIPHASLTT